MKTILTMKQSEKEEKKRERRKALDMLCSRSALLLSVVNCIALIHVELRIQEHHRLISYSVTSCDQMETKILKKLQPQSYEHWQANKGSHSEGHWQEIRGQVLRCVSCYSCFDYRNSFRSLFSSIRSSLKIFPQKMGFYRHKIGPSNSERQLLSHYRLQGCRFLLKRPPSGYRQVAA